MPLAAGQTLTHYEILGPLGAGGMGEVYLARDTRLDREVAIKVLPEELADDEERLRRFEREAKTLASLNHPNVAGIHGVDQVDEVCFLVLELVPGEDLATRLARGRLPVDEAIDVCRQIAEGLEVAHEAGVVHRDLKPANVRITPDGIVKILDFGLAKPIYPQAGKEGTTTAQSDSFLMTEEGLVLGTPTYMSPEQARGKPVDRRTDVWAFGCVLYECLTGKRPFGGESLTDILAAIVEREPDWGALPARTPAVVRRLLVRCLTKDPRQRLRDVGEARVVLEAPGAGEPSDEPTRPRRIPAWAVAGASVAATLAVVFAIDRLGADDEPTAASTAQIARLTSTGDVLWAAVSLDGRTASYVTAEEDYSLHVRQVATGSDIELVTPGPMRFLGVTSSPDGEHAYYTQSAGGGYRHLYRVPLLGGAPQMVVRDVDSAASFSPDGKRVALFRVVPARSETELVLADANGSDYGTALAATPFSEGGFSLRPGPAWSPDGRSVAVVRGAMVGLSMVGIGAAHIELYDTTSGAAREATARPFGVVNGLAWLPDGTLVASATEPGRPNAQLWGIAPDGAVRRLTSDLSHYGGVTTSRDGAIAAVISDLSSTISVLDPGADALRPVTSGHGRFDGQLGLAWTHAGELLYTSVRGGQVDLWLGDDRGGPAQQLTSDPIAELYPAISPDDEFVVFQADIDGGLVLLTLRDRQRRVLTTDPRDTLPRVLPDGKTVQFVRYDTVCRIPVEGGEVETLVTLPFCGPSSPDGTYVASFRRGIGAYPIDGSELVPLYDLLSFPIGLAWGAAGDALTALRTVGLERSLWSQPLGGDEAELVVDLGRERVFQFAWSDDGRLAVAHGPSPTDVALITRWTRE